MTEESLEMTEEGRTKLPPQTGDEAIAEGGLGADVVEDGRHEGIRLENAPDLLEIGLLFTVFLASS